MKKKNFMGGLAFGAAIGWVSDWLFFRRQWGAEADTLRSELNISRRQQQDMQKKLQGTDSSKLQGKLTASEARVSELEKKLTTARSAETKLKTLQKEKTTLQASLKKQTAAQTDAAAAAKSVETTKAKAAKLEKANKALKADLKKQAKAQTELDEANLRIAELEARLSYIGANGGGGAAVVSAISVDAEVVSGETGAVSVTADTEPVEAVEEISVVDSAAASAPKPDDLRRIEGIGPKIKSVMHQNGIFTFAQLAATSIDDLKTILVSAEVRGVNDPTTWPEQAEIAARGDWAALNSLQDTLQGGRRV